MSSMFFLNIYIRILSLDSHLQSEIHIRSLDHIFFYIISAGSLLSIYLSIYLYIYMCVCVFCSGFNDDGRRRTFEEHLRRYLLCWRCNTVDASVRHEGMSGC